MIEGTAKPDGPVGLGGWLLLLGIALIISPFRLFAEFFDGFGNVIKSLLLKPEFVAYDPFGSLAHHPWWKSLLVFDLVTGAGMITLSLILPVLFFRRSRYFPSLFIATGFIGVTSMLVEAWLSSYISGIPMLDRDTARELGRALLPVCVWVPYILCSKRVKNTFV